MDENGKMHFDDFIPQQYKSKHKEVVPTVNVVKSLATEKWKPTKTCTNPDVCDPNSAYNVRERLANEKRREQYRIKQERKRASDEFYRELRESKMQSKEYDSRSYAEKKAAYDRPVTSNRNNPHSSYSCGSIKRPTEHSAYDKWFNGAK